MKYEISVTYLLSQILKTVILSTANVLSECIIDPVDRDFVRENITIDLLFSDQQ